MSVIPSSILAAGVAAVTALATAGCQEPPPSDRIRASGHVEVAGGSSPST
jgi:uncharacterized protein YbjT (DUF2867 family)